MKKDQLARSVGVLVRLEPPARNETGKKLDDDWEVIAVEDDAVTLQHVPTRSNVLIGPDAIYNFTTDPNRRRSRDERCGFYVLFIQLTILADKTVRVRALPPPRIVDGSEPSLFETGRHRYVKTTYSGLSPNQKDAIHALLVVI